MDVLLVILLCMLVGRVDDSPLPSDLFVSSRRNDGKRDEVESLDGAAEGGGWSSAAELALLLLGLLLGLLCLGSSVLLRRTPLMRRLLDNLFNLLLLLIRQGRKAWLNHLPLEV